MGDPFPTPWVASAYLDNGEWGVLAADNTIVVGATSRISEATARRIAKLPAMYTALENVEDFLIIHADRISWYEGASDLLEEVSTLLDALRGES
jgi:hypothetical protein